MKNATILVILLAGGTLIAQPRDFSAECKAEMKKLDYFVGDWKGTAVVQTRNGPQTVNQTEHIEWKLNGVVLAIEGTGRQNEEITFHALAMVNFDPYTRQMKLRSYLKEGNATDAYFKTIGENKFEWGFDIPNGGKVRYSITLDPAKSSWYELGEYSADGEKWMKSIEMNLNKVN